MNRSHKLPPNVYLQSYLQKAGVRFTPNLVDTVCRRGLSYSFYAVLLLLCLLCLGRYLEVEIVMRSQYFYLAGCLCLAYLIVYGGRYFYYLHLRDRLRKEDEAPLTVEAYAVVLMDVNHYTGRLMKPRRSTILFKETGSQRPRFFTAEIKSGIRQHYYKDQIGRVYIDRKRPHLYTLDAESAFQTASARRKLFRIYELNHSGRPVVDESSQKL
ncbi:MAG: hypothetical protein K6F05_04700 [Succinivibrio sp.]|nr:hypothetical protein [Succinivibrio sp.]